MGKSRGGLSTKVHVVANGSGNLVAFIITGGHRHDATQAVNLLKLVPDEKSIKTITADKGYDSAAIVAQVEAMGASAVIPSLSSRNYVRIIDRQHYKTRNKIERLFCALKRFRRFATRYDKLAVRFAGFVYLAAALLWPS